MSSRAAQPRPTVLALWLIVAGVVGWFAAFELIIERLHQLAEPGTAASCDFNLVVQCGANLESWQGAVFGFPNPILGLTGWVAPIVVGAALLSGARFARWFWMLFWLGVAAAFAFVLWLIAQSVFVIGTLCPWCMVTWIVTIPTFYAVTLHVVRAGFVPAPAVARKGAATLMGWMPVLTVVSYAIIALIAQLRLDWIGML